MVVDLTQEDEKAILKLRNLMKGELPPNIYNDDVLLYKFLVARDFNLKKTELMLRNHLRYRKEIQIDTLMQFETPEVLHKYVAHQFLGFDKEGRPVRYCPIGNIDGIGIFKSSNFLIVLKHCLRIIETDKELQNEQSRKLGKANCQTVYIFNLEKLSFAQATHKESVLLFLRGVGIFQDNYPEMLGKVHLINTSMYFTMLWPLIKTFLAPKLLEKIHIHGQSGWKEELLKSIDADVLPAFLGGTRTDPNGNPMCLTFINHGGLIPDSYYLVKNIENTARKPGMKHIKLERQDKISIPIHIHKSMSILKWEFETKCHDIGFGLNVEVSYKEKTEELIPVNKLDTERGPLCGMYICDKVGTYTIVFDNSYSWIYQKDIYYRTWVTDPNDIE